ncbi:transmembrane 7 superfamily member 3-like isoform X2 [Cylas formicarius]|uniref:transmembrane 7 superfamily member 3-like isoform X2 n=1 Tax=Cylas formicarius TaxID=197179 RepID=UPI00295883A8|nr:transmembrane 7 superfamily member 3-like isoform X2 [Cylas formicarius]
MMFIQYKILFILCSLRHINPIPGGCNLSFETMIAPYQKISYTDSTIEVASQPPSRRKSSCNNNDRVQVDMYHMFLSENDPNETNYFTGIANMMTVERIKKNGRRVHKTDYAKYKIFYNLYRGTGEIFAVIATDVGGSSAYVPAASFGCDLSKWDADCAGPGKIVCMGLLLFGFVMCIAGHRLFKMSLFVLGFGLGQLVGSIFVNSGVLVTVFSILSGAIWVFLWIKLGVPLLSISLTFFFASTILISTVFYLGFAVNDLFGNDLVFWTTYACVFLSILLISSAFAPRSHILALSLIGSYCAIVAINYHSGGNLQYIFINTLRRINVAGFNRVIVDPPIQVKDIQHIATWIALFSLGYFVQSRWQRGAPPFPSTEYRMLRS